MIVTNQNSNVIDEFKTGNNSDEQAVNSETFSLFEENGVNGEIDEPVYQGDYGDCWLLSGILSMSYAQNGADKFKDSVNLNSDGSVDVTFDGIDKTYNIPRSEIDDNNMEVLNSEALLSTGDDDMLVAELAVNKVVEDNSIESNYSLQDGGNPYYIYKLYQAEYIAVPKTEESFVEGLDFAQENPDKCAMTLGIINTSICGLKLNHSYAVKSVDRDTVTVVDPWDSTTEIIIDKNELIENRENASMVYAEF